MKGERPGVAIVGTGLSRIGRRIDAPIGQLAVEACEAAILDAGLTADDIDGISNYPNPSRANAGDVDGIDLVSMGYLAATMPLRNLSWSCSITHGTFVASLVEAAQAVMSGSCTSALVYRAMHNPLGRYGVAGSVKADGDRQFTAPYGYGDAVSSYAMLCSRYMAEHGVTREALGTFVVANRQNANRNKDAVFHDVELTLEEYLASPMIVDPLCLLDCDMPVDGCGAVVVTTAERARSLPTVPAYLAGWSSSGLSYRASSVTTLEMWSERASRLAHSLWTSSGLTPADVHQINLYDGFSFLVLMWLEAFGFCGRGEAADLIASGATTLTGRLPLNTSGGALGMGRLHGTPQLIEGVRQIQRRCGERQVDPCDFSLVQSGSAATGCGAVLLSRRHEGARTW